VRTVGSVSVVEFSAGTSKCEFLDYLQEAKFSSEFVVGKLHGCQFFFFFPPT
jgi:hypothetical protein